MGGDRDFRAEQRGVALRMGLALAATVVVLAAALHVGQDDIPPDLAGRLTLAARAGLVPALWLAAAIGDVARRRFLSPEGIGGGEAPRLTGARSVLQNTLEQAALAWPALLAVALLMDRPASLLIALTGLFSLGRLLFWAGWRGGATTRALGFGLTFYPTVGALALAAVAAW